MPDQTTVPRSSLPNVAFFVALYPLGMTLSFRSADPMLFDHFSGKRLVLHLAQMAALGILAILAWKPAAHRRWWISAGSISALISSFLFFLFESRMVARADLPDYHSAAYLIATGLLVILLVFTVRASLSKSHPLRGPLALVVSTSACLLIAECVFAVALCPKPYSIIRTDMPWRPVGKPVISFKLRPNLEFQHIYPEVDCGRLFPAKTITYRMNSHGFRTPEYDELPAEGVTRIVFVGDSFTLGSGVPQGECFARRVEDSLQKNSALSVEVINCGLSSFNATYVRKLVEDERMPKGVSLVVGVFYINDGDPIVPEGGPRRARKPTQIERVSSVARWFCSTILVDHTPIPTFETLRPRLDHCVSEYVRMQEYLAEKDSSLVMVLLPDLGRFPPELVEQAHRYMQDSLKEAQIPTLDLYPTIKGVDPSQYWVHVLDLHANSEGHRIWAQKITEFLLKAGVVGASAGDGADD